jgi:putative glutathione S-transferase
MGRLIFLRGTKIFSVYKTGFATTQEAYEETVYPLFKSLDRLEQILKTKRFLMGDILTEAGVGERGLTNLRYPAVHYDCAVRCGIQRRIQVQHWLNSA